MTAGNATIAGHRCTAASVQIPSWGCWYVDVDVDGEVALEGKVTMQIADLSLSGTVLAGGAANGRSFFRVVAGGAGWGKTIPSKHYVNDGGVKLATVLGDAAREAGELVDTSEISPTQTVGTAWTRYAGPAADVLELAVSRGWYVDEGGITRVGRRGPTTLTQKVTHGPIDPARRTVTLAAESIASILPGIVVDGLEAVDVEHSITDTGELRSTIWGARGAAGHLSRRLATLALLMDRLDPWRIFRATAEYRVVTLEGKLANLQAVRASTGLPDLRRVAIRPGLAGGDATLTLGSRVLVAFVDADPGRPVVIAGEETGGAGFAPSELNLRAGGQVGGEHVATVEGTALLIYNTLAALLASAAAGPLIAAPLQLLLGAAVNAALTATTAPAPPTAAAQTALAATLLSGFASGIPSNTSAFFKSAIDAVSSKTPNESGLFPSLGASKVKVG